MTNIENEYWFCIQTKPLREADAVEMLCKLSPMVASNVGSIEIYYPKIQIHNKSKKKVLIRPLFPRYFFAKFCWQKAYRFIVSCPQILSVVQFGDLPSVVPENIIQELNVWSINNDQAVFDPTLSFSTGQKVIIKSGPFKGMEAEFISHLSDNKRVALLLDCLQRNIRVTICRDLLKQAV
jgi:transcription antitermination factor NusG